MQQYRFAVAGYVELEVRAGRPGEALAFAQRAMALAEKLPSPGALLPDALCGLADVRAALGETGPALALYQRAQRAAESLRRYPRAWHAWLGIGQLQLARNAAQAAIPPLEKAVALLEGSHEPQRTAEAKLALARAQRLARR